MITLKRFGTLAISLLCATTLCDAGTLIDFETLPDGMPPDEFTSISDSYASWGVSFWEMEYGAGQPKFAAGYGADGFFAGSFACGGYPPGFNIVADLSVPVYTVSADVDSAFGVAVTMLAKSADGTVLGSATSESLPQFWKGNLSVTAATPIASVKWWPAYDHSGVGVDNLFFDVPEPGTLAMAMLMTIITGTSCRR